MSTDLPTTASVTRIPHDGRCSKRAGEWQNYISLCILTAQTMSHGLSSWVEVDRRAEALGRKLRRLEPDLWRQLRDEILQAELEGYHCPGPAAGSTCALCRDGLYEAAS